MLPFSLFVSVRIAFYADEFCCEIIFLLKVERSFDIVKYCDSKS